MFSLVLLMQHFDITDQNILMDRQNLISLDRHSLTSLLVSMDIVQNIRQNNMVFHMVLF